MTKKIFPFSLFPFTLTTYLLLLLLLFPSRTFAQEITSIQDMKIVLNVVKELKEKNPACQSGHLLVVYDIDETLFTRERPQYCQKMWKEEGYQAYACESNAPLQGVQISPLTQDVLDHILEKGTPSWIPGPNQEAMCLTQAEVPEIIRTLQSMKNVDVMALTARPATEGILENTKKELGAFGIDLSLKVPSLKKAHVQEERQLHLAFNTEELKEMNIPESVKKKMAAQMEKAKIQNEKKYIQYNFPTDLTQVFYRDGIFMSSFHHKGVLLRKFLQKVENTYPCLVVIDDSPARIEQFSEGFLGAQENAQPAIYKIFKFNRIEQAMEKKAN